MRSHFNQCLCDLLCEQLHKQGDGATECDLDNLSFFDGPEDTMEKLSQLTKGLADGAPSTLNDSNVNDIIPYILIDTIVRSILSKTGKKVSDCISVDSRRISKLIHHLKLTNLSELIDVADDGDVWPFPIYFGRAKARDRNDHEISDEMFDGADACIATLDKWLEQFGFCIKDDFKDLLETHITEIIRNSDHSMMGDLDKTGGDWALSGYMVERTNDEQGKSDYICYMTLITLGRTIYENLKDNTNDVVSDYLEEYARHENEKIGLTREALFTAAATHDSVSSRRLAGGNGLAEFLHEFTSATHAANKELSAFVISGHGHIRMFGDYSHTQRRLDGRVRQAFNSDGVIYEPPDHKHVYHASTFFPGTIIGVRFFLDQDDLVAKVNGGA